MMFGHRQRLLGAALFAAALFGCRHGGEEAQGQGGQGSQGTHETGQPQGEQGGASGSTRNQGGATGQGQATPGGTGEGTTGGATGGPMGRGEGGAGAPSLTGDAVATLVPAHDQNLTGMAAFTAESGGPRLVVDVRNGTPGRYEVLLSSGGRCAPGLGSVPGSSAQSGMGGQRGVFLGYVTVDVNGSGRLETKVSSRQLDYRTVTALQNQAILLRQGGQAPAAAEGSRSSGQDQIGATDVGQLGRVVACGTITLTSAQPAS